MEAVWIGLEMLCALALWLALQWCYRLLLGQRRGGLAAAVVNGVLAVLWCLSDAIFVLSFHIGLLHLVIAFLSAQCYPGSQAVRLLVSSLFMAAKFFIEMIVYEGLATIYRQLLPLDATSSLIALIIIGTVLFVFNKRSVHEKIQSLHELSLRKQLLFWLIFVLSGILVYCIRQLMLMAVPLETGLRWNFVIVILLFILGTLITLLLMKMVADQQVKSDLLRQQQRINDQGQYYEAIIQHYQALRHMVHDYNNQMLAVSGYIEKGQPEAALRAIGAIYDRLNREDVPNTGLSFLDGILAEKLAKARQHDVNLRYAVAANGQLTADPLDIAVIVANGLDNAIEAAAQVPEPGKRLVMMVFSLLPNGLQIQIDNYTAQPVAVPPMGAKWQTTKADKAMHGLGMASIQALVDKCHGYCAASCEGQFFALEIFIPSGQV